MKQEIFEREISKRAEEICDFLMSERYRDQFAHGHLRDSVYSYLELGGKFLRPALLLFSCGAVGGDEEIAIPAAVAIEVFHTMTLLHDDIIDRDKTRRGGDTVHEEFRKKAICELGYSHVDARHYGMSVAILAGDMQQGWAASILCELAERSKIKPEVILYLIKDLEMRVLCNLLEGQVLDLQYSKMAIDLLDEGMIVDMLWKKTGVVYEFAGKAGAMIGLDTDDPDHPLVTELSAFAANCGIAFQLQDDILGIVGDEKVLGKPVGSDIREGKRTIIIYYAFKNAHGVKRKRLLQILGDRQAEKKGVEEAIHLSRELGGVRYAEKLSKAYVRKAITHLEKTPGSEYKELLFAWANYMIEREF